MNPPTPPADSASRRGAPCLVRRRLLQLTAAAPLAAVAAGCADILPGQQPPPDLYRLTPKHTFPPDMPEVTWQLVLSQPTAEAALDTTRIALLRDPTRLEYYGKAGWADRSTSMVQTLMLESFEASGKILAVGRRAIGLRSDFELLSDLREFQAEYYTGQIVVKVALNVKLVRSWERTIVGQASFSAEAVATEDSLPVIVVAFDEALGKVMKRLVEWVLVTGQANYEPPA